MIKYFLPLRAIKRYMDIKADLIRPWYQPLCPHHGCCYCLFCSCWGHEECIDNKISIYIRVQSQISGKLKDGRGQAQGKNLATRQPWHKQSKSTIWWQLLSVLNLRESTPTSAHETVPLQKTLVKSYCLFCPKKSWSFIKAFFSWIQF